MARIIHARLDAQSEKILVEIERRLGLSVYASIPHSLKQDELSQQVKAKVPGRHILAELEPFDAAVESMRSLRTAMQFQLMQQMVFLFSGCYYECFGPQLLFPNRFLHI